MLGTTLILVLIQAVSCRRAVFLVGDSTYQRLYVGGLVPLCNGTRDPLATHVYEMNRCTSDNSKCRNNDTPYVCSASSSFTRIGYTLHWGVGQPPYLHTWVGHRSANDTLNSPDNIVLAVQEFQARSKKEGALFIFLSNLWDVGRFKEFFFDVDTVVAFQRKYEENLLHMVGRLKALMRSRDVLALATCHLPKAPTASFVDMLNDKIRAVANVTDVKLFDESHIAGEQCTNAYLVDAMHQNGALNAKAARQIEQIVSSLE